MKKLTPQLGKSNPKGRDPQLERVKDISREFNIKSNQ